MCEEGPDPADVLETKSTRLGHRGNVGVAGQLVSIRVRFAESSRWTASGGGVGEVPLGVQE